ncbi:MAG TPA: hypothetical protein VK653_18645 [Xanthobacteraceae bacterium]|nr:hypothetical protein [Xanthobacteraceae bacterium]
MVAEVGSAEDCMDYVWRMRKQLAGLPKALQVLRLNLKEDLTLKGNESRRVDGHLAAQGLIALQGLKLNPTRTILSDTVPLELRLPPATEASGPLNEKFDRKVLSPTN